MAAMFSNARSSTSNSGNILEFKAGRSNIEAGSSENTRKIVADPKKGLVYIKQSNDMLTHFCWKDRESGALIDDLIIFPDDAEFKVVNGCPDGKVFMLKFKSSKDMRLYWLQDGSSDADKDLVKKVNDALNKPATSRPSERGGNASRLAAGGLPANFNLNDDFGGPLGGLDQAQLMNLLQSLGSGNTENISTGTNTATHANAETDCEPSTASAATNTTTAPPATSAGSLINSSDLSKILNDLQANAGTSSRKRQEVAVSLSDALSNESVSETAKANPETLAPHLPETANSSEKELAETVRTPQFRQAADLFGAALQSGQMGPVLSQFGLDDATIAAASQGDLKGFARNLTAAEGGELPQEEETDDSTKEPEAKRNRPDLDDMDVD